MKYKQLWQVAKYRSDRIAAIKVDNTNYISTENMLPDKGGVDAATSIPEAKSVSKYVKGDILLSNIRPYFKKIWFAGKTGGCSNDVLVVHPISINSKFLYFVLSDNNFFNYSTVTSKGTKMPRGSKSAIMKYLVPDIDEPIQTRIAEILSAYDDLIENNNRRIALLEKAAQELYKEWFVRFRFPGNENTKFENGLPEGWIACPISLVAEIGRGSSPRPITNPIFSINGTIPWIKIADATKSTKYILETKEYVNEYGASFSRLLKKGTMIIAASGTLGFPMYLGIDGCIHDGWMYFSNVKTITKEYLYFVLLSLREYYNSISYGAAIQNINTDIIRKSKIIVPSKFILSEFTTRIMELDSLLLNLLYQNQNLAKQRDMLLPRLMSGKLEV